MSSTQRGFTLVEVLVVLVITALVSTLLFQALGQVYRLQERFGVQLAQTRVGAMRSDWYRQVLQGLMTDYADGKQRFAGGRRHLEGLSATPLNANGGAPQWLTLDIAEKSSGGGELRYGTPLNQLVLLEWSERGGGEFAYLDEEGREHEQWPPQASGTWAQLPAAVLLRWPGREGPSVLVAAPTGSRESRVRVGRLLQTTTP